MLNDNRKTLVRAHLVDEVSHFRKLKVDHVVMDEEKIANRVLQWMAMNLAASPVSSTKP
ncbi:MAG: hypothetical protein MUF47_01380 [Porphyrobacter sp.]|nr:hypothetical protein [Porphyrobacter sp.]